MIPEITSAAGVLIFISATRDKALRRRHRSENNARQGLSHVAHRVMIILCLQLLLLLRLRQ